MKDDRIAAQREGGKKLGAILSTLVASAHVGQKLTEIEREAQSLIKKAGGTPSFETVEDYKWATCLCVNDEVVHGIPTEYTLKDGDVLTIDVGLLYNGYHTDTAWTKVIKTVTSETPREIERFLHVGEETLWKAIAEAKVGNHIGHISQAIQRGIEGAGYSVVKSLVGHTVGRELHEKPQVPGVLRGVVGKTPLLTAGMALAIEVIYAQGRGDIAYVNDDGWTIGMKDGSLSAVFEHTILVTDGEPEVLTRMEL